ncbi:tRNA (adenosine(37)-N6)-dimethylallyltransferase MiaA [Curvivirga sp.]|uniref:tRNA (adenosine(37)-N6)-dimethylallyltransferase MiaA n=1 Tax=Curvivirga sp. TaxID=2856848 RepID=UPI003B5BF086
MADILILVGPTASGKSSLAMAIAKEFSGDVINADSMQVYKDLRVLSARPSEADEAEVPHKLYGVLDADETCSAASWRDMAVEAIEETLAAGRLPIVCGGTGLYIQALTDGLNQVPPVDEDIRHQVRDLQAQDVAALHAVLKEADPDIAAQLNATDSQRMARALEVIRSTGKSLLWWQAQAPICTPPEGWTFHILALIPPRDVLYDRCNRRFDLMLEEGALEEIAELEKRNLPDTLPCMRALGVPELIAYTRGEMSIEDAAEKTRMFTRRYAKRQNTWIKNQIISKKSINAQYSEKLHPEIFSFIRKTVLTDPE